MNERERERERRELLIHMKCWFAGFLGNLCYSFITCVYTTHINTKKERARERERERERVKKANPHKVLV